MTNRYYNLATGKFNLSAIMKAAWASIVVRNNLKLRLSLALSVVWAQAKAEKASSCMNASQRNVARIERAIELSNYLPTQMNQSRRVEALQNELRAAA